MAVNDSLQLTLRTPSDDVQWLIRMPHRIVMVKSTVRHDRIVEAKVPILIMETGAGNDWSTVDW